MIKWLSQTTRGVAPSNMSTIEIELFAAP